MKYECAKHPRAKISQKLETTFIGGGPGKLGRPIEKSLGYFCAECGEQLPDEPGEESKAKCYRIKYWVDVGDSGYWQRTAGMSEEEARKIAEHLRVSHLDVVVYQDDSESPALNEAAEEAAQ